MGIKYEVTNLILTSARFCSGQLTDVRTQPVYAPKVKYAGVGMNWYQDTYKKTKVS